MLFLFVLAATMMFIPTIFAMVFGSPQTGQVLKESNQKVELKIDPQNVIPIKVYRNSSKQIETYPLEEYVRGVVAAEMPIEFELEALKAQSLAARTYIAKRLVDKNFDDVPQGAMVTDTVQHQVFISDKELQLQWGTQYEERISKLNQAINETSGKLITYNGQPIVALFFSTSNGYTENSEDYWTKQVPYLRSVASPWDQASPKYQSTTVIPIEQLQSKLKVNPTVMASSGQTWLQTVENTASQRVKKIKIGDKVLTGREVRELFDLPSSSFTWEIKGNQIIFHTKGYGHGVGMSQYGANGMAQQGLTAEQIVKYYYKGVEIQSVNNWLK